MNKIAAQQAQSRLEKAMRAFKALQHAVDHDDILHAWSDILAASQNIYNKLEKGAKGDPKSKRWFDRKKRERRTDPLLRYVHHARNADEHDLQIITEEEWYGILGHADSLDLPGAEWNEEHRRWISNPEKGGTFTIYPASAWLLTVQDARSGRKYYPPREHLGKPIRIRSVFRVAELAIDYLDSLVREAGALVSD